LENWKVISRIAKGFGIVFVIFAAVAAFISYEDSTYRYVTTPPIGFVQVSILEAMLPFLTLAVLSFVVAGVTSRASRENDATTEQAEQLVEREQEAEPQPESQTALES
jgi:Na+/proline symporter